MLRRKDDGAPDSCEIVLGVGGAGVVLIADGGDVGAGAAVGAAVAAVGASVCTIVGALVGIEVGA